MQKSGASLVAFVQIARSCCAHAHTHMSNELFLITLRSSSAKRPCLAYERAAGPAAKTCTSVRVVSTCQLGTVSTVATDQHVESLLSAAVAATGNRSASDCNRVTAASIGVYSHVQQVVLVHPWKLNPVEMFSTQPAMHDPAFGVREGWARKLFARVSQARKEWLDENSVKSTPLSIPLLRIGTDCAGAESPIFALRALQIKHRHMFSCEKAVHARKWIESRCQPELLLHDMLDRCHPDLPDLDGYYCGFPCTPWSLLHGNSHFWKDPAVEPYKARRVSAKLQFRLVIQID